jgi:hypothetical protein
MAAAINAHVREAAPDSAGKSVPGLCLAMEAFRAPTMPLIEPTSCSPHRSRRRRALSRKDRRRPLRY